MHHRHRARRFDGFVLVRHRRPSRRLLSPVTTGYEPKASGVSDATTTDNEVQSFLYLLGHGVIMSTTVRESTIVKGLGS